MTDTAVDSISESLADIEARLASLEGDQTVADELATIADLLDAIEARLDALDGVVASSYKVVYLNATNSQPLAPAAALLHDQGYTAWSIGMPASIGLENLAESGSPAVLLAESTSALDSKAGGGLTMPGAYTEIELEAVWREGLSLTIASMPVNTNDAFSGVTGWDISTLQVGESMRVLAPVYDAGTEWNSESLASIPGPAAGGEGYNSDRDDIADVVARHPGVVTSDDGYAESTLGESHKFDQGVMFVTVTRLD